LRESKRADQIIAYFYAHAAISIARKEVCLSFLHTFEQDARQKNSIGKADKTTQKQGRAFLILPGKKGGLGDEYKWRVSLNNFALFDKHCLFAFTFMIPYTL
jgi:hypothetical protein